MQRTASVLFVSLFAGLLLTGCPEKKVEKEEPAAPTAVDKSGAEEKATAEEEHGEDHPEGDEPKDDKKPVAKKKKAAGEEKDQGGW